MECKTKVVCIKLTNEYDFCIMRPSNWGNPFSHKRESLAEVILNSREEAVQAFEDWYLGKAYLDLLPEKRLWIRDHIHLLKHKRIACICNLAKGQMCHGLILAKYADPEFKIEEHIKILIKQEKKINKLF
jgi:hypothetical protein